MAVSGFDDRIAGCWFWLEVMSIRGLAMAVSESSKECARGGTYMFHAVFDELQR
jgi:hypothetical protein